MCPQIFRAGYVAYRASQASRLIVASEAAGLITGAALRTVVPRLGAYINAGALTGLTMSAAGVQPHADDPSKGCPTQISRMHSDETLNNYPSSYNYWSSQSTESIVKSLRPDSEQPLMTDGAGKIWQGNMRIRVLQERGFDVNSLPRTPKPEIR